MDEPQLGQPILSRMVAWGNSHHGIVTGTTLADGGSGIAHPAIYSARQSDKLWVTPALEHVVPGHVFTPPVFTLPEVQPADETWHDYATLGGTNNVTYRTAIGGNWLVSFGVGDTWRVGSLFRSVEVSVGGGTAYVTLTLTPFGLFSEDAPPAPISLVSSVLTPCGQLPFGSYSPDFYSTALKLVVFDVSPDGQNAILGVCDSAIEGFSQPRGFLQLNISKTAATLTLLKSRGDILGTPSTSTSNPGTAIDADACTSAPGVWVQGLSGWVVTETGSAQNLIGAYFDSAGVAQFIASKVAYVTVTTHADYTYTSTCTTCSSGHLVGCSVDAGQTVDFSRTMNSTQTVSIIRLGDGSVMHSTVYQMSYNRAVTGVSDAFGNWLYSGSMTHSYSGTSLGGGDMAHSFPPVAVNPLTGGFGSFEFGVQPYINSVYGAEFYNEYNGVIGQIGLHGLIAHQLVYGAYLETYVGHLRSNIHSGLPYDATKSMVISAHPKTGQVIHQQSVYSTSMPASYGWA
ncbi:MAG: hypothetical protein M0Q15_16045 [Nevskia sp.]|jgi:hypothetical protein|nr:hypothetical protein [Nevskia sp.]